MKRMTVIGITAAIMLSSISPLFGSSIKEREWRKGKLIDIASDPYTYGSVVNGTGGVHQGERITYVIDDGTYVYMASHTHRRRDKALPLTVNASIKFAVEKSKVYILDEDGDEHELRFVKKTLKDTTKEK
jgi:hypothetical protein